jgi:fructose-specific phosphotransferase system IIC component
MYGVNNLMPFVIGGGFAILIIGFSLRHKYVRCPNCSKSVDKVVRRYTKRCYCECV